MITKAQRAERDKYIKEALDDYCQKNDKMLACVRFIDEGGSALYYEMRDIDTGRFFVLKAVYTAITEADCSAREMDALVQREIDCAVKCEGQENICDLLDAWYMHIDEDAHKTVYLLMYRKMVPIANYFDEYASDAKSILAMTSDICRALSYCHDRKIRHGNVKISNIYYSRGNKCFALSGFGASRADFDRKYADTDYGSYIAPEILKNKRLLNSEGDERCNSDIYSLGIATLLLLSRNRKAATKEELLDSLDPPALKDILKKAIDPDPVSRYQTAAELRYDIENIEWEKKEPLYSQDVSQCIALLANGKKDEAKALAEAGNRDGDVKMACVLAYVLSAEQKPEEALAVLEPYKASGNRAALGLYGIIGCRFYSGKERYKECLLEAANKGFGPAQYYIGRWCCDGQNGFKKDVDIGVSYINASANQGFIPAFDYFRKMLKRQKIKDSDAMLTLLDYELETYNEKRDFGRLCIEALVKG